MIVLPVAARELGVNARQVVTYYLRSLGAGMLLLGCILFGAWSLSVPSSGRELFAYLQVMIFWSVWICVPLLAADCLSREKRERTLGLLFLTKLSGFDVVVAKGLAHGLRAATIVLATVPVITLPLLIGGIGWKEILLAVSMIFSALCLALAAGVLASALSRSWVQASVQSLFLACLFVLLSAPVCALHLQIAASMVRGTLRLAGVDEISTLVHGIALFTNANGHLERVTTALPGGVLVGICLSFVFEALAVLLGVAWLAGRRTRSSWQDLPPSRFSRWLERVFCTPRFLLPVLAWWLGRKLARNPVGWLEQRRWTGRLVVWSWFAVVVSIYSAVLTDSNFFRNFRRSHELIAWFLLVSMAITSAGSFRRERETGCLELLLVSPLGENEIILGRLRGIWSQFAPAAGLLLFIWVYFSRLSWLFSGGLFAGPILWQIAAYFAVPVVGLYFSLRCRTFPGAFFMTVLCGFILPNFARAIVGLFIGYLGLPAYLSPSQYRVQAYLVPAVAQVIIGGLCAKALFHRLRARNFAIHRGGA